MWVLFTARKDDSNKIKAITRYCDNQVIANLVSKAFLNKMQAEKQGYDFVTYEFSSHNAFNDFNQVVTINDVQKSIMSNPCTYSRWNDIGLNGLHQFM